MIISVKSVNIMNYTRNVQADNIDTLNKSMVSIKRKGFINYYGANIGSL